MAYVNFAFVADAFIGWSKVSIKFWLFAYLGIKSFTWLLIISHIS